MTVNAFWFGVLMTIVLEIVVSIIFAIVVTHKAEDEDAREAVADEAQFKRYLKETILEIADENKIILGELEDDGEKEA